MAEFGSAITRRDMYFHQPRYRDYAWMETNWFSWIVPEHALRGHLRAGFRTNLDVAQFNCYVWDDPDPRAGQFGVVHSDIRYNLPLPRQNLDRYQLLDGDYSVTMLDPLKEWTVRYRNAHDVEIDLHLRAMMPPLHVRESQVLDAPEHFVTHHHLDQMMHVTGRVRFGDVVRDVDWAAPRDHSWGPRPEGARTRGYATSTGANFDYGSFGPAGQDFTFFVLTSNPWDAPANGEVHSGYILDHGRLLRLASGRGRYWFSEAWVPMRLEYDLVGENGSLHRISGEPRSFYHAGSGTICAVVEWTHDSGERGWGEYLWHGDVRTIRRLGSPPQPND